jgi:hypothetical protein
MEIKVMSKLKLILVVGFLCGLVFSSQARKEEITLVLVPRNDATIQLGLDIANRYPTLLISYLIQGNGSASLHGWTGTQWVNVKVDDFKSGEFFKTGPDSALIIEQEGSAVPDELIPPEWCKDVSKITTTQIRPLVHLIGQYYNFDFKDWKWFSKRYNQPIEAINPEGLNLSWYHKPLNEHLKEAGQIGASDLQYWVSVRQSLVLDEPAEELERIEDGAAVEAGNPLTNEVPSAVILGAGDVPEEHSDEPLDLDTASTNVVIDSSDEM